MKTAKKRGILAFIETAGKTSTLAAIVSLVVGLLGYIACIFVDVKERKEMNEGVERNSYDRRNFDGRRGFD